MLCLSLLSELPSSLVPLRAVCLGGMLTIKHIRVSFNQLEQTFKQIFSFKCLWQFFQIRMKKLTYFFVWRYKSFFRKQALLTFTVVLFYLQRASAIYTRNAADSTPSFIKSQEVRVEAFASDVVTTPRVGIVISASKVTTGITKQSLLLTGRPANVSHGQLFAVKLFIILFNFLVCNTTLATSFPCVDLSKDFTLSRRESTLTKSSQIRTNVSSRLKSMLKHSTLLQTTFLTRHFASFFQYKQSWGLLVLKESCAFLRLPVQETHRAWLYRCCPWHLLAVCLCYIARS